jgi:aconitase A
MRNGIDVMTTEKRLCLSSIWESDDKTKAYLENARARQRLQAPIT